MTNAGVASPAGTPASVADIGDIVTQGGSTMPSSLALRSTQHSSSIVTCEMALGDVPHGRMSIAPLTALRPSVTDEVEFLHADAVMLDRSADARRVEIRNWCQRAHDCLAVLARQAPAKVPQ